MTRSRQLLFATLSAAECSLRGAGKRIRPCYYALFIATLAPLSSTHASVITMDVGGNTYTSAFWTTPSPAASGAIPGNGTITLTGPAGGSLRNSNSMLGTLALNGPPAGTDATDAFPIPTAPVPAFPGDVGDQLFMNMGSSNLQSYTFSEAQDSILLLFANLGIGGNSLELRLNGDALGVPAATLLTPSGGGANSLTYAGGTGVIGWNVASPYDLAGGAYGGILVDGPLTSFTLRSLSGDGDGAGIMVLAAPVPEPGSLALIVATALLLAGRMHRRRRSN